MYKNKSLFFLWGLMGSGKSFWAKQLASKLHFNCIDTDLLIENKLQLSTSEIFEKFGESFFREKEQLVLQELIETITQPTIISTGGGMPCFFNNADLMNKNGVTIFLKTDIPIIVERVFASVSKRPLLKDFTSKDELFVFLEKKLAERVNCYSKAHYIFDGEDVTEFNLLQIISKT